MHSLDDPKLRDLKIGVQLIGDDGANSPPAHALARRGLTQNIRGYSVIGDYSQPNPPAAIVRAVAENEVDVALVWGPLAGYFAKRQEVPLAVAPVASPDEGQLPFTFEIAMGVRHGNKELRDELNTILARKQPEIDRILDDFDVPRVPPKERSSAVASSK